MLVKFVEEFRPLIVDSVVLNLLNNRQLAAKDFVLELNSYRMTDTTKRLFLLQMGISEGFPARSARGGLVKAYFAIERLKQTLIPRLKEMFEGGGHEEYELLLKPSYQ